MSSLKTQHAVVVIDVVVVAVVVIDVVVVAAVVIDVVVIDVVVIDVVVVAVVVVAVVVIDVVVVAVVRKFDIWMLSTQFYTEIFYLYLVCIFHKKLHRV